MSVEEKAEIVAISLGVSLNIHLINSSLSWVSFRPLHNTSRAEVRLVSSASSYSQRSLALSYKLFSGYYLDVVVLLLKVSY